MEQGGTSDDQALINALKNTSKQIDNTLYLPRQDSKMVPYMAGFHRSFVTTTEEVYYRVYSGKYKTGFFFTKVKPSCPGLAIEGLALPPSNKAEWLQEVIVPKGVWLQRSRAKPAQFEGQPLRRGGMEQFELLNAEDLSKILFKDGVKFE